MQLQQWLLGLVNLPEQRLAGAQKTADCLADHLRDISRQAGDAIQSAERQTQSLRDLLLNDRKGSKDWLRFRGLFADRRLVADQRLSEYFELCLRQLALSAFCRLVRLVLAQVTTVGDKLRNLATDLNRLFERQSASAAEGPAPGDRSHTMRQAAAQQIASRRAELLAEMDRELEGDLRHATTTEGRELRSELDTAIRRAARTSVLRMLKQFADEATAAALEGGPHEPQFEIQTAIKEALPRCLTICGGQRRLLIVAPEQLAPRITPQACGDAAAPTVITDSDADLLVCYEVEDLPLGRVASAVVGQRFQAVEAASRLHTRMDVPWTTL
jgi:hypothetical protein